MNLLTRLLVEVIRAPLLALWYAQGWRMETPFPPVEKGVMLAVPHTSYWDFYHMLMMALVVRRRPHTTTKHTLFRFPLSLFLYATGCIPINREQALRAVDWMAEMIVHAPGRFVVVFTPEGTRSKTKYWKSGFYYTALKANVPIMMGYIDYQRKRAGFSDPLMPAGDIQADFERIKAFYMQYGRNGKYPEKVSDLALKERRYEPLHAHAATEQDAALDEA